MKKTLKEFLNEVNPYGIPYVNMIKRKTVIVDIPINHNGDCAEVEGVISSDIWCSSPNCFYSQIKLVRQNTKTDVICLSKDLHAIYPEKIKRIYERIEGI